MKTHSIFGVTVCTAVGLLTSVTAQAVPINYGDFVGTTVQFMQVTEDSTTDPVPLFGVPTVAGDALDFNPTNFVSSSSAGASDTTTAVLDFYIEALPGNFVDEVLFYEAGDYTIFGTGGVGTLASVTAPVNIDVLEVDGVAIVPVNFVANMVFSPSAGDYDLANDGAGFGVIWSGVLDVDVAQLLTNAAVPYTGGATKVMVSLSNTLTTTSEAGSFAEIQKKDIQGFGVTVVPEPASLVLLTAIGLPILTRRKK